MDRKQRVLKGDLTDISKSVNDFREGSGSATMNSNVLYIGAEMPFNHKYFNITTANAEAKTVESVHIWDGNAWQAALDVVDGTASDAGVSLAKSGVISWDIDPKKPGWCREQDTADMTGSGLSTLRIFDLFWCRITFSNGSGSGVCDYVGERFSDDNALFGQYPEFRSSVLMKGFKSTKTDWNEQCITASELVISHLRRNRVLFRREQILDSTLYREAAIHKTASIICNGLGNGYVERMTIAEKKFLEAVNITYPEIDVNGDGKLTMPEKFFTTTLGTR